MQGTFNLCCVYCVEHERIITHGLKTQTFSPVRCTMAECYLDRLHYNMDLPSAQRQKSENEKQAD